MLGSARGGSRVSRPITLPSATSGEPGCTSGVEIVTADAAPDRGRARAIVEAMRDAHVLISVCGEHGNVLKIRPPLVFSDSDVDWFCTALDSALATTLATAG